MASSLPLPPSYVGIVDASNQRRGMNNRDYPSEHASMNSSLHVNHDLSQGPRQENNLATKNVHLESSRHPTHEQSTQSKTQQEVRLWESSHERRALEDLSDLYAIIKTTEHLETAYVRDSITQDEYEKACTRLISQYKTAEGALRTSSPATCSPVGSPILNVEAFMEKYRLDCPRAVERLVKLGVPATVVHATVSNKADSVVVAQTVQHFITAMDTLKLNVSAIDQIQPMLSELMSTLTQVTGLPPTFEGRIRVENWLRLMNTMRASDELNEDQSRQLFFELDQAYTSFIAFLGTK